MVIGLFCWCCSPGVETGTEELNLFVSFVCQMFEITLLCSVILALYTVRPPNIYYLEIIHLVVWPLVVLSYSVTIYRNSHTIQSGNTEKVRVVTVCKLHIKNIKA